MIKKQHPIAPVKKVGFVVYQRKGQEDARTMLQGIAFVSFVRGIRRSGFAAE
jgi:hypothetical protein